MCIYIIWITLSAKASALSRESCNPVELSSLGSPVESSSLDALAGWAGFKNGSIAWKFDVHGFFRISKSAAAVVVDDCCSSFKKPEQLTRTCSGDAMKRHRSSEGLCSVFQNWNKLHPTAPDPNLTETSPLIHCSQTWVNFKQFVWQYKCASS